MPAPSASLFTRSASIPAPSISMSARSAASHAEISEPTGAPCTDSPLGAMQVYLVASARNYGGVLQHGRWRLAGIALDFEHGDVVAAVHARHLALDHVVRKIAPGVVVGHAAHGANLRTHVPDVHLHAVPVHVGRRERRGERGEERGAELALEPRS